MSPASTESGLMYPWGYLLSRMRIEQYPFTEEGNQKVALFLQPSDHHLNADFRLEKTKGQEEKEAEEDRNREEDEARDRAIQEFERVQMGLEVKVGGSEKQIVGRENGKILVEEDVVGGKRGEKRKFELDEDELLRIAREERTRARKAIDEEKVLCCPAL
jgi:hypothetical protein